MPLEDIFAGRMELTARERSFILHVLTEWYMGGGDLPSGVPNRRTFVSDICGKVTALKLEQMVIANPHARAGTRSGANWLGRLWMELRSETAK